MTESQETPAIKAENNGQYKIKNEKDGDGDVDAEPAHHARRPMNAFLIFCKRHRSVVRDKYPNLENRSITKILGEWWANLEKEEKASYTGLAKQYKDAFFDANPGFKWYKLPAPPLRTFATRPANSETVSLSGEPFPPDDICRPTKPEQTNNNHLTKLNYNVQPSTSKQLQGECKQMFTPGKLADEAQMGGISSLFLSDSPPRRNETNYDLLSRRLISNTDVINPPGTPKSQLATNSSLMPNPPKKRPFCDDIVDGTNFYRNSDISPPGGDVSHLREAKMQKLQDALSETTRSFAMSFQSSDDINNAPLKQLGLPKNSDHNNENINDFSNFIDRDKSKGNNTTYNTLQESSTTHSPMHSFDELTQQKIIDRVVNENLSGEKYQSNVSSDESQDRESHPDDVHGFDPALSRSTGRACKGKRYKQFMAHGGLMVNKRPKKEHDSKLTLRNDMRNRLPYGLPATCSWKAYDAETKLRPLEPDDAIDKLSENNVPFYEQRDVPVSAYKYPSETDDTGQHGYYYDEHSEQGGEIADNLGNKMFKASDFDLDAKIGALPSLSLDKFLLKKKENKKRKKNLTSSKHNDRPRYPSTVLTPYPLDKPKGPFYTPQEQRDSTQKSFQVKAATDRPLYTKSQTPHQNITHDDRIRMAEQRKSVIIGSKKRKPRKHSITRLDVNSSTNLQHCNDKAEIVKTTCTNVDKQHMKPTSNSLIPDQNSQNTEDLYALATLAEVAANTCKINEDA